MIFCDLKIKVQISLFINKFSLDPLFVYIFSMASFVLQKAQWNSFERDHVLCKPVVFIA